MKKTTQPVRNESLRKLREILGLSQERFAALVGASVDLIKSVETGRRQLSGKLGKRIHLATGARIEKLDMSSRRSAWVPMVDGTVHAWLPSSAGGEHIGFTRTSHEYTAEHFRQFQKWSQGKGDSVKLVIGEVMPRIEALLNAATRSRPKGKLPAVRASLMEWIMETDRAFKLGTFKD